MMNAGAATGGDDDCVFDKRGRAFGLHIAEQRCASEAWGAHFDGSPPCSFDDVGRLTVAPSSGIQGGWMLRWLCRLRRYSAGRGLTPMHTSVSVGTRDLVV